MDFVLDGEHVDPVAVQMALQGKGPDRVCLITDANVGAGLAPGRYEFVGGAAVEFAYPGGPERLRDCGGRAALAAGPRTCCKPAAHHAEEISRKSA